MGVGGGDWALIGLVSHHSACHSNQSCSGRPVQLFGCWAFYIYIYIDRYSKKCDVNGFWPFLSDKLLEHKHCDTTRFDMITESE